ncbi:M6 metalloprotease [Byssothecium circinans]|uniref:M6 metalloprotease n=1 Tax=Byssothecium circinans TaxID=147558 RepID=A0A6A5TPU0_9PLEO|nr:M6 metalloprotease [Byssothecium circinans]
MGPRHCDKPCFVPPHPDLLRTRAQAALLAQNAGSAQAAIQGPASHIGKPAVPGFNDGLIFPAEHYSKPTSIMAMSTAALDRAPLRGSIKVVVVLIEFQDVKMKPGTKERFQELLFSAGNKVSTGSVSDYYLEVSNRNISFEGEVVGPFTVSQTQGYYANHASGMSPTSPNGRDMADETFELAKNSISNWKQYDNDGNGYVDAFIVVHAGAAADETGQTGDIWSFKWVLNSEKSIGVFGWPDLYDTDQTPIFASAGIGNWCLMSGGSWGAGGYRPGDRPCHPSAWCKASQGWIETVVETENHQITLEDVKTGFKTHRLWTNGDTSSQEYYLVENRQLTGFDESLPGAGLLVWHIDDAVFTNRDENHLKVKLMQADGLDELKRRLDWGDNGDPYPGLSNNATFNATSNPNSKAHSSMDTFVSCTNIPASSPSMTFNITVKPIGTPPTGDFDPKKWYRLKNTYNPPTHSLDVINDNGVNSKGLLQTARDGNFSGQHWQIKSNGDGTYFLRTLFLGANRRLDVYGNDMRKPVLQPAGWYSGQYWTITGWGDGTYNLSNAYGGPNLVLDTKEGGPSVWLNDKNTGRPTERWTITPIRDITENQFL